MKVCRSCGELVGLCDECDAMWMVPDTATLPIFPSQPDVPCPFCGVGSGWEHWKNATWEQIQGTRWEKSVALRLHPEAKGPRSSDEGEQDAARL